MKMFTINSSIVGLELYDLMDYYFSLLNYDDTIEMVWQYKAHLDRILEESHKKR